MFPRSAGIQPLNSSLTPGVQFLAQVGHSITFQPSFDNIGFVSFFLMLHPPAPTWWLFNHVPLFVVHQAFLTMFVIMTGDNYDVNMKMWMTLSNFWVASLFTIATQIVGVYIFLNLFLAILLANLDQLTEDTLNDASTFARKPSILTKASSFASNLSKTLLAQGRR